MDSGSTAPAAASLTHQRIRGFQGLNFISVLYAVRLLIPRQPADISRSRSTLGDDSGEFGSPGQCRFP